MGAITTEKTYTGTQLADIFYRPTLSGKSAEELGMRVLYNMPMPLTLTLWSHAGDGIKAYQRGFQGGDNATRVSKTIDMTKCKLEQAFSPEDYFATVYETLTNTPNVNLQDLQGSDLEKAETDLFRAFIRENLRVQMWVGKKGRESKYNVFDGFLTKCLDTVNYTQLHRVSISAAPSSSNIIATLSSVWKAAPAELKTLRSSGELAYFVTSDVIDAYEAYLDSKGGTDAYKEMQNGRTVLKYHGIELIEAEVDSILADLTDMPESFVLLAPKKNLVFALNTAAMPDADVRMWYNADELENRQRACFLAGAEILDENLVVFASKAKA